jgi:hypothetical protein
MSASAAQSASRCWGIAAEKVRIFFPAKADADSLLFSEHYWNPFMTPLQWKATHQPCFRNLSRDISSILEVSKTE